MEESHPKADINVQSSPPNNFKPQQEEDFLSGHETATKTTTDITVPQIECKESLTLTHLNQENLDVSSSSSESQLSQSQDLEFMPSLLMSQGFEIQVDSPAHHAIEALAESKNSKVKKVKHFIHRKVIREGNRNEKMCKSYVQPQVPVGGTKSKPFLVGTVEEEGDEDADEDEKDKLSPSLCDAHGNRQSIGFLNKVKSLRLPGKKKSKNVKGSVIKKEHELYTLSIAVMLGLRYAIYNTQIHLQNDDKSKHQKWLSSSEFMHIEKYVFTPDGRKDTPPHMLGHTFKFKDYAPVPFAYIRRMFGINEYDFIDSICANADYIEFLSNSKSGQFFFYSSDGKYMIKTMSNTESKFLRRILPHYFQHCAQNPNTLITKFLGMYRVKLHHLRRDVKFVIMNSVFDTDKIISSIYDVKGSSIGRSAEAGEAVKKDNDVRDMIKKNPNSAFLLYPEIRERLRKQVVRDCTFLKGMKIFDYSMLIGTHYIPSKTDAAVLSNRQSMSGFNFSRNKKSFGSQSLSSITSEKSQSDSKLIINKRKAHRSKFYSMIQPRLNSPLEVVDVNVDVDKGNTNTNLAPLKLKNFGLQFNNNRISILENQELTFIRSVPEAKDLNSKVFNQSTLQLELCTEQSYWPFHRYYKMDGKPRSKPMDEIYRKASEKDCEDQNNNNDSTKTSSTVDEVKGMSCLGDSKKYDPRSDASDGAKWELADFHNPISKRRDGGLKKDASNIEMPMKVDVETIADTQIKECNGEIYYMGIIDVLQQFNVRKRGEANYKRLRGWDGASCIHPDLYADRFIKFFDECTKVKHNPHGD